jgi:predicted MPP superfamily phosphohydrolase
MTIRIASLLLVVVAAGAPVVGQGTSTPADPASLKFAVIGDMGTGDRPQHEIGRQMAALRSRFPFDMVLMVGDNLYGSQDFTVKFERPYAALLEAGVKFYAALGNHDDPAKDVAYRPFGMNGQRYYTFSRGGVQFLVLDSNAVDRKQLAWAESVLAGSNSPWKVAVFHHPLYSDGGRHGSDIQLRIILEPLLVQHGVAVVFSGHDHIYERTTPQKGITYFVAGSGGKLARSDVVRSRLTAAAFDQDQAFVAAEVKGDQLSFEAISRTGAIVDSGIIRRQPTN